ncbi:beta strand repeat-containing protein [Hymenobacter terricola]|uniref:beta strand repeat-containing protein n=1 Tax=Hymenobacter terricola TaxID=2819236 RepID=UPI0021D431A5|nr:FG-GAP-like repeat-containing protein [Hymenobacter terricola]
MKHMFPVVAALAGLLAGCGTPSSSLVPAVARPRAAGPYQPAALRASLATPGLPRPVPARFAAAVPADTSATGMAAVWADVHRRSYFLAATADQPATTRVADNAAQHLVATLAPDRYTVAAVPDQEHHRSAWQVGWQLRGIGRAGGPVLHAAAHAAPVVENAKATFGTGQAVVVEYENSVNGLRQTFHLSNRPAGTGPVRVRLHLATALRVTAAADGAALSFAPASGGPPVLRYADLRAWDATGRALPAHMALGAGHALALVVNDAQATYPITVDPLASAPGTTLGDPAATAYDDFGYGTAGVGDVNGDGYGDVVVGAFGTSSSAGKAYLYLGTSTGLATTPAVLNDPAATANDYFGFTVAGVGDVNGDGYGDGVLGAFGTSSNAGKAYLYLGTSTGLATTPAVLNDPAATANDNFGFTVAGVGDVNGDGYGDVVIGAFGTSSNAGKAYLYLGTSTGLATTPAVLNDPAATANDNFGFTVAGVGDVNGDGYGDVVIGAFGTSSNAGKAYLYLGTSTGLATTPAVLNDPAATANDNFGFTVAGVGDVNGDGYGDVVIGAFGTSSNAGKAYLYLGTSTGLATTPAVLNDPAATANDYFAYNVAGAGAGDVNGDGYSDIIVGAQGTSTFQGKAYVYLGSSAGLVTTPSTTLSEPAAANFDYFGRSAAGVGDVNGDGYADVMVGAYGTSTFQGKAYVYLGSSTGVGTTTATTLSDPAATANDTFGNSVAGAGDVNGDGYSDVIVGASGTSGSQGNAYVYLGSSTGVGTTVATTLSDPAATANDAFGASVAGAGDVNGDGYSDVIVGASGTSGSQGNAYVYLGSSTGVGTTVATTLSDPAATANDAFGASVAGAGDVNGDGYADLIVGAPRGSGYQGNAYVYLGSSTGVGTTAATTLSDPTATANDAFGNSVAGAGDVNGDGYADLIVGAPRGSGYQGNAYVYYGGTDALLPTPTATRVDPPSTANDYFGRNVIGAGDVNGDGYADLIVGAPRGSGYQGNAYVYYGGTDALLPTPTATRVDPPSTANDYFGRNVIGAGDVNGDGYADVLINADGTNSYRGTVYLYLGSSTGLAPTAAATLSDPTATANNFGQSVAGAGDVNGDGYADVLVGADGTSSNRGTAYLYLGSSAGLNTAPAATLSDPAATNDDFFGGSVAGAGDVNGDGYADALIGADGTSSNRGTAYLYLGSSTGLNTAPAATLSDPAATNDDFFGGSVAGAGDVNGDGYADALIGADGTSSTRGKAYLYLGSGVGLGPAPAATLNDPPGNSYDQFGASVAGAGDVNGDGYADVLVGANSTNFFRGRAYLYLGSSTGLGALAATLSDPANTSDAQFGVSVAGAGDVNGDGYADVLVGANSTNFFRGRAYLYLGSSTGLGALAATLSDPANTSDAQFGVSVAGAGDVNGDGYADVLIGAYGSLGQNNGLGKAYCYLGSSAGLGPAIVLSDPTAATGTYFGSGAGVGDVNGDGYADILVGAYGTSYYRGTAYLYLGNLGAARAGQLRLYNTDLTTPLSIANRPLPQFGIGLVARSAFGRVQARLVWEAVANGASFSHNSPITNSTAYTGRGAFTTIPAAGAGTELKALVSKAGRATRVRARLEYAASGVGGVPRYGPWTYITAQQLGQSTNSATPLPVELATFTATPEGPAAVRLAWATASEKNSQAFEVERSADGKAFTRLGAVAAAGSSSSTPRSYGFLDNQVPKSLSPQALLYYRLRQVDLDGTAHYSPVRSVTLAGKPGGLTLAPNPARATTLAGAEAGAPVQVYDALGRLVLTATADAAGTAALALPTGLAGGVYVVRAGAASARLVVE